MKDMSICLVELLFFPSHCAVSSKVESMKISKSGNQLQELNKIKAAAAAGSHDKDNFHACQKGVAKAARSFPSACAVVVPAGWEAAASALLWLCSVAVGDSGLWLLWSPSGRGTALLGSEHHWAARESSFIPEVKCKAS